MRFVLFSDLHVHRFAEFGADSRMNDCISVLKDVRNYCIKNSVWHVFFGGDLFHVKGVVHTKPYVMVAEELKAFKDAGVTFYAVDGNHDHENQDGSVHAMQPLIAGGLVKGVGAKGYRVVEVGQRRVAMFSYCDSRDVLAARIRKSLRKGSVDVALFHHGFKGARVGSSLEYEVKEPIDARKLNLNKLFKLVFSGHYHTHQRIVGCKRGWYVGSPLEHTRSDRCEEPKGFLDVDLAKMTFKRVPLSYPRFVSVNAWEEPANVAGNFVDIVYKTADGSLDAYIERVRALGARGVNPVALPQLKAKQTRRLNVSPELAPGKVLKRYVKHKRREIRKSKMDRGELIKLGMELLKTK